MKTAITIKTDVHQTDLKKGDQGYIEGFCMGADGRPYVYVVIPSKGIIDGCPSHCITTNGIYKPQ